MNLNMNVTNSSKHFIAFIRSDIKKFLTDGIEEEKAAKQECIKLPSAVNNEEL